MNNLKKHTIIAGIFACSSLLATTSIANAANFAIDQLTVTKNGNVILNDTFDNGDSANGGTFSNGRTATYTSPVNALPTTETGGKALLDPITGKIIASGLTGQQIYINQGILNTNVSNSSLKLNKGLKDDDTFKVRALFDLVEPTKIKERFGLRLTDRGVFGNAGANGALGDVVEVDVRRLQSGVFVEFREQDRPNNTNITIDRVSLTYASFGITESTFAMYDQIAFQLNRVTTASNITASFTLVDSSGANADYLYNFRGDATIFQGERFTRVEYISVALAPVPEASTIFLFAIGLLGLFSSARRKI